VSKTVFVELSESGFSCPPMTVTNQAGDELSLDESCALEFSPAPASTDISGSGPVQTSKRSAAETRRRATAPFWRVLVMASLVIVTLDSRTILLAV
jgi:hypothetical protein